MKRHNWTGDNFEDGSISALSVRVECSSAYDERGSIVSQNYEQGMPPTQSYVHVMMMRRVALSMRVN